MPGPHQGRWTSISYETVTTPATQPRGTVLPLDCCFCSSALLFKTTPPTASCFSIKSHPSPSWDELIVSPQLSHPKRQFSAISE